MRTEKFLKYPFRFRICIQFNFNFDMEFDKIYSINFIIHI